MELQSDTGSIALAYSAKSVNIVAGGKGEGEGEELSISEDGVALTNIYFASFIDGICKNLQEH
jgi:hypothetical protein